MTRTKAWIEGARLRTLPVSMAGVIAATALAWTRTGQVSWSWAAVCMVFALLAQIASNFANEYFDYKSGVDLVERSGPERGVAAGVITPQQMLRATIITLALACAVGLTTVWRAGWQMIPIGALVALAVFAYSAGPFPLSRHCLGEVAVVIFYGIIPVCLTYYILTLQWRGAVLCCSVGIGLVGAMVILVNNYRDIAADRQAGKRTLSTLLGPQGSALLYCAMGQLGAVLLWGGAGFLMEGAVALIPAFLGLMGGWILYRGGLSGPQCTRLLAITALTLLLTSLLLFV